MSATTPAEKSDAAKRPVEFEWAGTFKSSVFVAGNWNEWDQTTATPLKRPKNISTGFLSAIVDLHPGEYTFKFIVDGEWCLSENVPTISKADGSKVHSVLVSHKTDSQSSLSPSPCVVQNRFETSNFDIFSSSHLFYLAAFTRLAHRPLPSMHLP
jgi:hypothetical protein